MWMMSLKFDALPVVSELVVKIEARSQPIRSTKNHLAMKRSNLVLPFLLVLGSASVLAGAFPDASYTPPPGWNSAAGDPVFVLAKTIRQRTHRPRLHSRGKRLIFMCNLRRICRRLSTTATKAIWRCSFVDKTTPPKWYHAPWLHPGPNGREFTAWSDWRTRLTDRANSQRRRRASSTILQSACIMKPVAMRLVAFGPTRTILMPVKRYFRKERLHSTLFTTATKDQVPYLDGAPEWVADTQRSNDANQIRGNKVTSSPDRHCCEGQSLQ